MSSILPWEEMKHIGERSGPKLPGRHSSLLFSQLSRARPGLGPYQDLPAVGHLEEHGEAISANEQVAGREETSPRCVTEPQYKWENKWSDLWF